MKMNYKNQLILTVVIILVANGLNTIFHHWLFSSIGRVICGLIWLLHPVMIGSRTPTKRDLNLIRLVGVFLILYGIFGRIYLY